LHREVELSAWLWKDVADLGRDVTILDIRRFGSCVKLQFCGTTIRSAAKARINMVAAPPLSMT